MDRFRKHFRPALAKQKSSTSLRRIDAETVLTQPPSELPRERRSAPYRHPFYARQLSERGSFLNAYKGISVESKELCQKLLTSPQSPPKDTLFEDDLNDTRVIRDIAQLIVPSAEILALCGAKHLEILRETTNASWDNAIPLHEPRPQPDYSLRFKREAFTEEQLQKLRPFIGDDSEHDSYFAATHDMYFPFLTSEVRCGLSTLEPGDRQNAHSQTVALRGIFELFRLVGRHGELHNTIGGFSYSHSDVDPEFYRERIERFDIVNTDRADTRWVGWTVAMKIFDLWATDHFKLICSAVDMLPASLDFEASELSELQPAVLSHPGSSQKLEASGLANDQVVPESQLSI
ncbi:hypothetical protein GGR51DRAFT_573325 [Nemania sp. FL0031]|nr:hypothetical protein GGR51DRAFT_573325 [Nemania sp. FL0031]